MIAFEAIYFVIKSHVKGKLLSRACKISYNYKRGGRTVRKQEILKCSFHSSESGAQSRSVKEAAMLKLPVNFAFLFCFLEFFVVCDLSCSPLKLTGIMNKGIASSSRILQACKQPL